MDLSLGDTGLKRTKQHMKDENLYWLREDGVSKDVLKNMLQNAFTV